MIIQSYTFADEIQVDQSGKLTIAGTFDNINTKGFPSVHKLMYFLIMFEGNVDEEGDHSLEIIPYANDKTFANSLTGRTFTLPPTPQIGPSLKNNYIVRITDFPIPEMGVYTFEILVDGHIQSQLPYFTVTKI